MKLKKVLLFIYFNSISFYLELHQYYSNIYPFDIKVSYCQKGYL